MTTLIARLLDAVEPRLVPHGFRRRRRAQAFERAHPHGRSAVHLAVIRHRDNIDVTVDVAVRFDRVETIIGELSASASAGDHLTFTLGAELGNLVSGKPERWSLSSESQVEETAAAITERVTTVGFSFFDRFTDPDLALEVLERDDRTGWLYCPLHDHRAKSAVTLAWICHGKERAAEVARRKLEFLRGRHDHGLPGFEAFVPKLLALSDPRSSDQSRKSHSAR